jgi:cytochrome c-type biogenesis protein
LLEVTVWGAFIAGLISFVSPCVLPIVPPYLCYLAGVSLDELSDEHKSTATLRNVFFAALAFVLGFTTVFVMLGATASAIGRVVTSHLDILSYIAGAIIIVMGLHFLGLLRIGLLYREARVHVARKPAGLVGSYLIGLAFAFGWTPCVGPILGTILFIAGAEDTVGKGAVLLAVYSLGLGVPFLLAAAFAGPFLEWARGFRRHMATVEKVMGGMLVLTGVLILSGQMAVLSYWLLETFPGFAQIG